MDGLEAHSGGVALQKHERAVADLEVASQLLASPTEVGPVITSLHGRKQLTALSKTPFLPKNMHTDEAGLLITAIA